MASRSRSPAPCAACKLLRKRCSEACIFIPYFPPTEPEKFAAVHRVFGARNASKMLKVFPTEPSYADIPANFREDAVISMVYEANARLRDPVYGCVASIAAFQIQNSQLQRELTNALAENIALKSQLSEAQFLLAHLSTSHT
ncbi:LOB domain-containing protein 12-like [Phoenix dactylifera]|uniref:LOB domain-containing protein 12-like n=1 Tax=Phoenix dactylifera TaxID=42345 RepID=A0A8B9A8D0_PHODC|nr:LOB domain-containing protein 12-like [Phoenix dactylifera]